VIEWRLNGCQKNHLNKAQPNRDFYLRNRLGGRCPESLSGYFIGERRNVTEIKRVYEVRPRKDKRGVAAISDALPFIIALIVGGVLVFMLLYFGSFLVTRRQDARLRSQTA